MPSPFERREARLARIQTAHPDWSRSECEQHLEDQTDEYEADW